MQTNKLAWHTSQFAKFYVFFLHIWWAASLWCGVVRACSIWSLLEIRNFDISVDVARCLSFVENKYDVSWMWECFAFSLGVYECESMKLFQNEFTSCWHCNYSECINIIETVLVGIQFNPIFQSIRMTFFSVMICCALSKSSWLFIETPHTHTHSHSHTPKTPHRKLFDFTMPIFLIVTHFLCEMPTYRDIYIICMVVYHRKPLSPIDEFYGCHTAISFHFITYDLFDYRSFLKWDPHLCSERAMKEEEKKRRESSMLWWWWQTLTASSKRFTCNRITIEYKVISVQYCYCFLIILCFATTFPGEACTLGDLILFGSLEFSLSL